MWPQAKEGRQPPEAGILLSFCCCRFTKEKRVSSLPTQGSKFPLVGVVCECVWRRQCAGRTVNRTFRADRGECVAGRPSLPRLLVSKSHHLSACAPPPTPISRTSVKMHLPGPSTPVRLGTYSLTAPQRLTGHFKG